MSDILIAGGGPAGAAAAIALVQAGREVTLLEREEVPGHKICGEFVSGETRNYLTALGMDLRALGGHRITHVRLARGAKTMTARLPFEGVGLTRKVLDGAMLEHAVASGVMVRRGVTVRKITGIEVETSQNEMLRPHSLLLATGKHEARGAARAGRPGGTVGFKNYFSLSPAQTAAMAHHVELIIFPGGYAGLELVETGEANFSLLIDARELRQLGGKWENLLEYLQTSSPHLAMRLSGAQAMLAAPLTIARVPYGFLHRPSRDDPPRRFRLGDQAAVIQSFTGDGMAIALHSAALAARHVLAAHDSRIYHRALARGIAGQMHRANALHAALTAPVLGPALFAAAQWFPEMVTLAASLTRIPAPIRLAS
jgi:flavin-dependent dehydrogenase